MGEPPRTPDGRYVVIDGRRWRASDPRIPDALRAELVSELMAARRAVRDATSDRDERTARDRVQDAKVALGERGAPWWEPRRDETLRPRLAAAARTLLRKRGPGATTCPSDLARIVGGAQWRDHLGLTREVVDELAGEGRVVVLQGGARVASAVGASGPVRIGQGDAFG